MKLLAVGRVVSGLLLVSLSLALDVQAEAPGAIIVSPAKSSTTCSASRTNDFPRISLDCKHQLQYLGAYSAEGRYVALSPYRAFYNRAATRSSGFEHKGRPLSRPTEVPDFVKLSPPERVVENYGGRAHAVQVLQGQSKLAGWRDRIVTFAYGREQVLMAPQHLTMDSRGRLIISDPMANAVHVLDGASSFRIAAGGRRHLTKPAGVAVDAHDNLYVVDSERGLVEVYSPSGVFLRNIGQLDDETLFIRPAGIAIDRERERIYLLDEPRNLMLILDLGGHILKRIGRRNSDETPVEFRSPSEVATGNGAVVVLDRAGTRIQVLDLEGRLLRQFSTHIVSPVVTVTQSEMGLGIDSKGNIYLSNVQRSEICIFDSEGRMLNTFGKMGAKEVQFRSPSGLWVQDTRLFVADTDNRRIAVFEIQTQPQQKQEVVLADAP